MRLSWLLSLPAVLSVASALAIQKRDADFFSVRTKMHTDMSGKKGDPKGKYFHESIFHPHYDGRFADKQLGYRERKQALSNLIQTYLSTFADIGVETWLMHGTLLGWWWNRKILPWDSDSDVQVSEPSMHYLASYYNMTVFHYKTPRIPEGRDYMLEINPHYVNREQTDKLNVIDARWVDTTSGLFIDITTARYNHTHPAGPGMMSCKDGHEYRDSYIFPLRETFFEGTPAKIPFAYKEILEAEYRQKALTMTDFEEHHFDEEKLEWIPVPKKDVGRKPLPKAAEAPKPASPDIIVPSKAQSPADGPPALKQPSPPNDSSKDRSPADGPLVLKQGLPTIDPSKAQSPAEGPPVLKQAPPANDPSKAQPPAGGPLKQPEIQNSQTSAETPPIAKQPNTLSSQQPTEPPKQPDKPKKPNPPQPPDAQRAAENKIFTTEQKRAQGKKNTELLRKLYEEEAIDKKEKRKAAQKQFDAKLAATEAKKQASANEVMTRTGSVPSR